MVTTVASTSASTPAATNRYPVTIEQYREFRRWGLLIVRGLVSAEDVAELREHTEELMDGRLAQSAQKLITSHGQSLEVPAGLTREQRATHFLRIHMLHRIHPLHEKYLLHARVLDVLEVIIGPDVLALQSMLFLKGPGQPGQGWHQDSYYIGTSPDTLCGAWIAIDDCDEQNGAMWFAKGSGPEPVYPPRQGYGYGDSGISNIVGVDGVSDVDDRKNDLAVVADRYDQILATMRAGDVAFFNGHILHRSKQNVTADRFRRSFVGHYCNARSFTPWGAEEGKLEVGSGMANASHILARGDTHLPFAQPRFGTACAATLDASSRRRQAECAATMMGDMDSGKMMAAPAMNGEEDDD